MKWGCHLLTPSHWQHKNESSFLFFLSPRPNRTCQFYLFMGSWKQPFSSVPDTSVSHLHKCSKGKMHCDIITSVLTESPLENPKHLSCLQELIQCGPSASPFTQVLCFSSSVCWSLKLLGVLWMSLLCYFLGFINLLSSRPNTPPSDTSHNWHNFTHMTFKCHLKRAPPSLSPFTGLTE